MVDIFSVCASPWIALCMQEKTSFPCVHVNVVGDLNALIAQASTVIQAASSSKDEQKTLASLLPSEKLDSSSDPT